MQRRKELQVLSPLHNLLRLIAKADNKIYRICSVAKLMLLWMRPLTFSSPDLWASDICIKVTNQHTILKIHLGCTLVFSSSYSKIYHWRVACIKGGKECGSYNLFLVLCTLMINDKLVSIPSLCLCSQWGNAFELLGAGQQYRGAKLSERAGLSNAEESGSISDTQFSCFCSSFCFYCLLFSISFLSVLPHHLVRVKEY